MERRTLFALGLAALAAYLALTGHLWLASLAPERLPAGVPAPSLRAAAREQLTRALEELAELDSASPAPLADYREHLRRAATLLERSLRADPAQAEALVELAATRWELEPFSSGQSPPKHLAAIALASRMAPRVPRVQQRLGELLLRMGLREDAYGYLARTVSLNPRSAARVVAALREQGAPATEILERMPSRDELLAALEPVFREQGLTDRFLDAVAARGAPADPRLLRAWGTACLATGRAERLADEMTGLSYPERPDLEAERLHQRSHGLRALGRFDEAVADLRRAAALGPEQPRFRESLGSALLAAGDADGAIEAFRDALRRVAAGRGDAPSRARLYRRIGEAEERAGRPGRAYDAYRKAVSLQADEPVALRRMAEMTAAAHEGASRR